MSIPLHGLSGGEGDGNDEAHEGANSGVSSTVKEIADALTGVYKIGGISLALVLVSLIIIGALIQLGVVERFADLFTLLVIFLLVSAVMLFLVTAVSTYLEVQSKLRFDLEKYRAKNEFSLEQHRRDTAIKSQFTRGVIDYAATLSQREGLKAEDRQKEISSFIDRMSSLVSKAVTNISPSSENEN